MAPRSPHLPSLAHADWLADPALQRVLSALEAGGGEARVAGGAVRNALLGEPVTDIDIATTEVPEQVMVLGHRAGLGVHPTGLDHGTVTLVAREGEEAKPFEVTTLRVDVETFGRHAKVAFTDSWRADAERRDFTINALYCDRHGRVLDLVGGYSDILKRRVRFVGEAEARIREDYLRILRFFRFHASYGSGRPNAKGLAACVELREGLNQLSAERIRQELFKLLVAPGAVAALKVMAKTGILACVLPGEANVARFARMVEIEKTHRLEPDPVLRLAALVLGVIDAESLRERLRLSNREAARLDALASNQPPVPVLREGERRIVLYQMGCEAYRDAVRLGWAAAREPREDAAWSDLLVLPGRWSPPRFPVTGDDLIARGIPPGPGLGAALQKLEDWWMASGFPPDKETVLKRLAALAESSNPLPGGKRAG